MLADLLRRLAGRPDEDGPLPDEDVRTAIAALLVIAAHADGTYAEAERATIEKILAARYGLDAAAAAALRAEGEAAEAAASDLFRFTHLVKQGVPYEERAAVIEALWRVVLADAHREAHEDALMRRLTDLLGLDPRESVLARQRVEQGG